MLSPSSSEQDTSLSCATAKGALKPGDAGEEGEAVDGKLSIFIHKREDQSSHEVLQPLLRYASRENVCLYFAGVDLTCWVWLCPRCSSSEGRPFRLGTGANMEKVVKMDRDMTKVKGRLGSAEHLSGCLPSC